MANSNIVMVKLYAGDFIIGEEEQSPLADSSKICLSNPRIFHMMPSMSGNINVSIVPVCSPFKSEKLKKELILDASQVMFKIDESELDGDLVNGYKSEISGIKMPSSAQTAAVNGGKDLII